MLQTMQSYPLGAVYICRGSKKLVPTKSMADFKFTDNVEGLPSILPRVREKYNAAVSAGLRIRMVSHSSII